MQALLTIVLFVVAVVVGPPAAASSLEEPQNVVYQPAPPAPRTQLPEQAAAKSRGCMSCHEKTDSPNMHSSPSAIIGCTDCHGGNANVFKDPLKEEVAKKLAHVLPRYPLSWNYPKSANPKRSYTLLNRESPEYIRFINPSDLRIARESCGACHLPIIQAVERSLMSNAAMFWAAAAYNNGILPYKHTILGEGYTRDGQPAKVVNPVVPDENRM